MNTTMTENMAAKLSGDIAKTMSGAVIEAFQETLNAHEKDLLKFKEEAVQKINEVYGFVPTQTIELVNGKKKDKIKLSGRVSPFLVPLLENASLGIMTLMVGPAGCGKTTTAAQLAEALELPFGTICFTAGASETWLFGRQTPTGFVEGIFSKLYREGGVFLADEMDAADANLMLSINTALSHTCMLNPISGELIEKHKDFVFVGAANTNGKGATHVYTGRSRLDAATMDRFAIINVTYDRDLEKNLLSDEAMRNYLWDIRGELASQEYEEFVSTRAFILAQKKLSIGNSHHDVAEDLISSWGQGAQDIARNKKKGYFGSRSNPKQKVGKKEIDFSNLIKRVENGAN